VTLLSTINGINSAAGGELAGAHRAEWWIH